MKLSDYVVDFLSRAGTGHNFLVTGGAVLHLADSTARHPKMMHVGVQHEEFGAAAADGYYRASGKIGVAMTTSGPGATNLLTSVCNAHFDSIPLVCVTGQVARFRLRPNKKLRQRGFQETDISSVFESVCKYVVLVTDPRMIRYELEKALHIAKEGRPGPVVVDIPDDLQREEIDPDELKGYIPQTTLPRAPLEDIVTLMEMIASAKRPVIITGAGIHCAHVEAAWEAFIEHFQIPVLLTWGATDALPHEHPLNMGGVGVCGPRAGNFAVQQADLVITLGTRLSQMITGGKQSLFAPHAKKVMIDIDTEELNKFGPETFCLDLPIHTDLTAFFEACAPYLTQDEPDRFVAWREKIQDWKIRYPVCTKEDEDKKDSINPYVFIKHLSKQTEEGDIFVADTGANICWTMQAFETKKKQRIFSAWNHTPMGYALPASIGAAFGATQKVHCLIGDGGFMMCLQELATVSRYNLPIKLFLFDNKGHSTVKQTIEIWLNGRYVVVDKESGLSFPDYEQLAKAFSIPYHYFATHDDVKADLHAVLQQEGPAFCHLNIDETHRIVPMLKFGAGLEDLDPKLPDAEIEAVMAEGRALEEVLV